MVYRKNKSWLFAVLLVAVGVAGFVLLWGGRGGSVSYVEMACAFEGENLSCVDTLPRWNSGLRFFDSTLSVTQDTLAALKALLWEYWDIEFAGAGASAVSMDAVLPLQVLRNKKSGCVGLAWLALMVAEKRSFDLQAILLPGHVFLRYGKKNLEPNRRGYFYTDEEYREKYKDGVWTGLEFKPLLSRQLVGIAAFDIGNLFLENDVRKALSWYRMAEKFFPEFPGVEKNLKIAKKRLHQ
ncbi:MAG: hypothetical protein HUK20_13430 [Fibrobacter sp.]|nr:hypothetical protein [Fibrobacter sp.]